MDSRPGRELDRIMGASMKTMRSCAILLASLLSAALFSGCSFTHVKPWERSMLARPGMQIDPEPLISACDDHIYFSREASKGGRSYAGGGCGCN